MILESKEGNLFNVEDVIRYENEPKELKMLCQALLDRCNHLEIELEKGSSQKNVGIVSTVGGYPDDSEHTVKWVVKYSDLKDGDKLYTHPSPSLQATQVAAEAYQVIGALSSDLPHSEEVIRALDYFSAISCGENPSGEMLPFLCDWEGEGQHE